MRRLTLALLLAISGCAVASPAPAAYRSRTMVNRHRAIAEVTPTASKSNVTAYSAARRNVRSDGYSSAFCTALDPSQKNVRGAATAGRALLRHSMKPAKPADRRANFLIITALQNMVRRNISYPGRRINRAMAASWGSGLVSGLSRHVQMEPNRTEPHRQPDHEDQGSGEIFGRLRVMGSHSSTHCAEPVSVWSPHTGFYGNKAGGSVSWQDPQLSAPTARMGGQIGNAIPRPSRSAGPK